ncbi:hypothetical protein WAI453_003998 [Rhynchosporium graminicola]|uniref:Related to haloacetate dehalogenase H-1 n=1 Tax=Rhynchosporium graminicola TaxID=2792576 RepID=A0A1E1JYB8_9HELO|nr:related to haloacetate dehalogenase H-1 [Rhynchosporium commune]
MFPGFQEFDIAVTLTVTIHGIKAGNGPPLLLIHGFPQTHHIWHKITPSLTNSFTVIAIDLRGYGKSSKPPSTISDSHKTYSKSVMGEDCIAVMLKLGYKKFSILSHDRGARVAHKLSVDHPEAVEKLMMLDIAPTLAMFEQTNQFFATAYWHWFWLIQPAPFPEKLMMGDPELFKGKFFGGGHACSGSWSYIEEQAMSEYMGMFKDEACVHAMCEDYRAAATIDLDEARKDRDEGKKIKCPVRVLWGSKGVIEKSFDCLKEWRSVSDGEVSGESVPSGHYIAEEVPEILLKHVREFFS